MLSVVHAAFAEFAGIEVIVFNTISEIFNGLAGNGISGRRKARSPCCSISSLAAALRDLKKPRFCSEDAFGWCAFDDFVGSLQIVFEENGRNEKGVSIVIEARAAAAVGREFIRSIIGCAVKIADGIVLRSGSNQ